MFVERHTVSLTTATDGTGTAFTPRVTGRVLGIHYIADGTTPFTSSTASVAITSEETGVSILARTATGSFDNFPRLDIHTATGGTRLATGATINTYTDPLHIANDRVKIAVASGGAAKTGRFDVVVG